MKEKQLYTAPEADLLVVRFEGGICQSINALTQTELYDIIDGGDL